MTDEEILPVPGHSTSIPPGAPTGALAALGLRLHGFGTKRPRPRGAEEGRRSACDSERLTTVTHGQSWSLDGCAHENAKSIFALVRPLEASLKLVVRGRVELPTFRFSGWRARL